jgi:hypothetical protein
MGDSGGRNQGIDAAELIDGQVSHRCIVEPAGCIKLGEDGLAATDDLNGHVPGQEDDDGFYPYASDSAFADDDEFPDDAQPLHLFPDADTDPRFARLSAEQLDDENWQPSGEDAHEDGMVQHVVSEVAAMKTPGMSRRAQQRASQMSWAGGPMDSANGEDGLGAAMGPNSRSSRRKPGGNAAKRGGGGKKRRTPGNGQGSGRKRGAGQSAGGGRGSGGGSGGNSGRGARKGGGNQSKGKTSSGNKGGARRRSRGPRKSGGGTGSS